METLDPIPVEIPMEELRRKLRVADWTQVQKLLEVSVPLIQARACFKVAFIERLQDEAVQIDGVCFKSHVLRKNLEAVGRVFPYAVSIGSAMEKKSAACDDLLDKFYVDTIANIALREARKYLQNFLSSTYRIDRLSYMSPGSLPEWPIQEQIPLFALLGGVEDAIGVRLTDSFLMMPVKSVSGIFFPTEVSFYSCQLCSRERCEGRKAPFSRQLAEEHDVHR
jgi:hypothetical protein